MKCIECGREMSDMEHNYGTLSFPVCIQCATLEAPEVCGCCGEENNQHNDWCELAVAERMNDMRTEIMAIELRQPIEMEAV